MNNKAWSWSRDAFMRLLRSPVDKTSESYRLVSTPPPIEGADEYKLEYLKQLISAATDDSKHVMLYITASLGITVLVVSQILGSSLPKSSLWVRLLLVVSMGMLGVSSAAFFRYARKLHLCRLAIVRCIPTLNSRRARELWAGDAGVWKVHGRSYLVGLVFFTIGLGLEFMVVAIVLLTYGQR